MRADQSPAGNFFAGWLAVSEYAVLQRSRRTFEGTLNHETRELIARMLGASAVTLCASTSLAGALEVVPNVGHDQALMSKAAAQYLYGSWLIGKSGLRLWCDCRKPPAALSARLQKA